MEPFVFRHWWALALRGLIAILFGLVALVWPALALNVLVTGFGVFALVSGALVVMVAVGDYRAHARWWALLLEGLTGILVGLVALFWPGFITALALLYLIAAWSILTGLFEIVLAVWMRRAIGNELLLLLGGLASILFGILLVARPAIGLLVLTSLIGIYALIAGVLLVFLALQSRGNGQRLVQV